MARLKESHKATLDNQNFIDYLERRTSLKRIALRRGDRAMLQSLNKGDKNGTD